MESATQTDYLKENADNVLFVLGAYFFAFFPWTVVHSIDFISEKWRTCRRTRQLAHINLSLSIFPIVYVAVYAEAQRRANDNKELGAALAALMFNVVQLMRTIMGWVQLNAFVPWCKHAMECMQALQGEEGRFNLSLERPGRDARTMMIETVQRWQNMLESSRKRGLKCIRTLLWCHSQNDEQRSSRDEEHSEPSVDENSLEDLVMVNNIVVDNELGGREVTVLPSWKKVWSGVMNGRFTPSKWLQTDRVILNTVRWCGAYLCGMGERWSVHSLDTYDDRSDKDYGEILEAFFSKKMQVIRGILQRVEWDMNWEQDDRDFLSIHRVGCDPTVDLTGEMSTAYGNRETNYDVRDTSTVDVYSFEFNSLVSSYPTTDKKMGRIANRERIGVGLVHSVLLAKQLGVERLKAIRHSYDRYRLPKDSILREAFKLLVIQTNTRILDDSKIWEMFKSIDYQIPVFPYRMQMVSLWSRARNWRVLQASAHQDIESSFVNGARLRWHQTFFRFENGRRVLRNAQHPVDIFHYCAKRTTEHIDQRDLGKKGSLGVGIETVRTFLAEWITASVQEPNWEPEVPTDCVKFNIEETLGYNQRFYLIWVCQRELQRKVAEVLREEKNIPGNAGLIMLFILVFPLLDMNSIGFEEVIAQDRLEEVEEASEPSFSNRHCTVDLIRLWRAWTPIAPQDISLIIRVDSDRGTVSLRLQNDGADGHFIWQDWVDAAMGSMRGFEEGRGGELGYGRKIVRADLGKSIVGLSPLRMNDDVITTVVEKTGKARVWTGWPVFDVRTCKFEVDQWLDACKIDLRNWQVDGVIETVQGVIGAIASSENEEADVSKQWCDGNSTDQEIGSTVSGDK